MQRKRSLHPEAKPGSEKRGAFTFLPRKSHHSEPGASRATLFLNK